MTRKFRQTAPWIAALAAWASAAHLQASDFPTLLQSHNPVGYWKFNESTASPALNRVVNAGSAGSAADGYVVLDVGKGETGKIGKSIRLVNTGNTVGHCGSKVDVPYSAAINPTAPFSVEFWAKPNSLGADGTGFCPISCFDPNFYGGANRSGWLFYLNNAGRWNFRLGLTSGYAVSLLATGGNATAGNWQHIVATYDGSTARIYIDGVLRGSGAVASGWKPNSQMALRFGGTPLTGDTSDGPAISSTGISGNRGYDGWLDEIAIYPSLLSDAQVAAHFAAANSPDTYGNVIKADAPVGYWPADDAAVTTPDASAFPAIVNAGSAGAGANGTVHWGVATAQPGIAATGFGAGNKSAFFDGENGYIEVADAPELHFSGNITMLAWVKPTGKDFFRNILAHGWDSAYAETFLRISRGEGDIFPNTGAGDGNYYEVGATDGVPNYYDVAQYPIPDGDIGNWVFLAGTYDGSNWNLYRNGALVASAPSPNGALDVATPWTIGSRAGTTPDEGLFFRGGMDEPAVLNKALTASQINALYQAAELPPYLTRPVVGPTEVLFKGSSVSLSVWAEGGAPLTYSWTSNNIPLGVTTTNITINNLGSGTHKFTVIVSNPNGILTSSVNVDVQAAPPVFTKSPVSVTRFAGYPFSFSAELSGSTPLSYQWKLNGNAIPGATSATYTGTAGASTAGSYTVTVTNEAGNVTSAPATLTVLTAHDGYASAIVSSSTAPVAFWRLGESSGTAANDYVGGHNGIYHNVTLGQPGSSDIDPDFAASFVGANSYVGDIVGDPASGGINFSGHVNFTIELFAKGAAGQADESTLIAKGTGSSGTTATEQFALDVSGGKYRFLTRGANNSIYSATAAVGPDGTWQHIAAVYDDAAGSMTLYVNGVVSGDPGATRPAGLRGSASPVTIGAKHLGNDPAYDGAFSGLIDEVAIFPAALSAETIQQHYGSIYGTTTPPFIVLQPSSTTNYIGLPVTLKVAAAGTLPLSYQWKKNGANIDGAIGAEFTIDPLTAGDAGDYTVVVSNPVNAAGLASSPAKVTALAAPSSAPSIPDLVLHLPFNNSLADSSGRGNNATGMKNVNGTASAGPATYVADGALGQGFHFTTQVDSGSTNTSYASLGIPDDLKFGSTVNFTFAFWIRSPANYAEGDLPFITDTIGSTFGNGLVFAYTYGNGATTPWPGGWAMSIFDVNGTGVGGRGEIGSINDGAWHHLVHVFDRQNGQWNYLDGRLVAFNKQSGTTATAAGDLDVGNAFTIGQDPTGAYVAGNVPLDVSGDIDDLGVWRRALTPLEAAAIYTAGAVNHLSFTGTPPAPPASTITVARGANGLTVSWAPTGGRLQSTPALQGASTVWTDVGTANPATVPTTGGELFLRVVNP